MRISAKYVLMVSFFTLIMTISGVFAAWKYAAGEIGGKDTTQNVTLNGFEYGPPEGVYITDVKYSSAVNATNTSVKYSLPTTFLSTFSRSQMSGSITYQITVYNNTNVTYWYLGPAWNTSGATNQWLGLSTGVQFITKDTKADTTATFNQQDWIPPYTTRDFYITFNFGANAINKEIITALDFQFGIKMDAVHDGFLAILNDTTSENGYNYLTQIFDERYAQNGSTVIANVGEDKAIFDKLFGGALTLEVDGVEMPVTLMIQRDNVDNRSTGDSYDVAGGPTGCEYTLYITVDALNSPTGQAMVYAISYSSGGVGNGWYQLGQLYEGTAPAATYGSGVAFDITKWKATAKEYEFVDGKTYKVGYEQGDQYDKLKTLKEIMSANDQDVYNDIDNSGILRKVYAIVYSSANYNKPGYEGLRAAFEAAAPLYNVYNNGQEVKIKRQATRAELLPYMIAIQTAYDYYLEVNI